MNRNAEGRRQKAEKRRSISAFCLLPSAFLLIGPALSACPVCYGQPGPSTDSVNSAIFFMLGIVGIVQLGFVALFWSFRRRAKALQRHRESFRVIEGGV